MEEDIKILEEKLKIIESLCTDNCINESTVIKPLKYAIENLIKGYREREEKYNELMIKHLRVIDKNNDYKDNYIPKSKIKEKIEELVRYVGVVGMLVSDDEVSRAESQIEILEELMEDK